MVFGRFIGAAEYTPCVQRSRVKALLKRLTKYVVTASACLVLAGCGNKGKLFLPDADVALPDVSESLTKPSSDILDEVIDDALDDKKKRP